MAYNQKTTIAFKKAQSHLNKVVEMVEGKEYCIDIMQQNWPLKMKNVRMK